jgi:hypothetical protein
MFPFHWFFLVSPASLKAVSTKFRRAKFARYYQLEVYSHIHRAYYYY